MVTALIVHRVADYDAWRAAYDRLADGPEGADVRAFRIWRGLDDPNLVVLAETFESRAVADRVFDDPELPELLAGVGVDAFTMEIHFVEEVAARAR